MRKVLLGGGSFLALTLLAAMAFAAGPVKTSEITQDKLGQEVELAGTVKSFQASRSERAPNSFKLDDGAGSVRVAIWPDVFSQISAREALREGARVKIKGKVAEFRGALEIHVNKPSDVVIEGGTAGGTSPAAASTSEKTSPPSSAATAPGAVTPIAQLTSDKIGQKFTIQGTITSARRPSSERAPYILKVKDATGSIDIVFWQNLADQLSDAQKANEGDVVRVSGTLGEYRGSLQLKPEKPADIQTNKTNPEVKAEQPAAKTVQEPQAGAVSAPASDLSVLPVGSSIRIEGKVVAVERMRLGQKLTISNGTQRWLVIVWATASGLRPAIERVRGGEDVTLQARVELQDGQRILVVTRPEDVLYVG